MFNATWRITVLAIVVAAVVLLHVAGVFGSDWAPLRESDWTPLPTVQTTKQQYAAALEEYQRGRPMLIYYTAKWCAPCRKVKPLLPRLRKMGVLVEIDIDEEKWARKGMVQAGIPQVVIFYKSGSENVRLSWVGVPEITDRLQRFEAEGIYYDGSAKIQTSQSRVLWSVRETYIVPGPVSYRPAWEFGARPVSGFPMADCGPSG